MDYARRDASISLFFFGCGLAFGLSGALTYYKARQTLRKEVRSLSLTIDNLRKEVRDLKDASQNKKRKVSFADRFDAADSERCYNDYSDPTSGTVSGEEDEFFDFTESDSSPMQSPNEETSLNALIQEIDSAIEDPNSDKEALLMRIKCNLDTFNFHPNLAYRAVKVSNMLVSKAKKESRIEDQKELAFRTLELAEQVLAKNESHGECNKWFAIAVGGVNDFVPMKEKIANGQLFKKHVDYAISLNKNDAALYHMLGRFCESVAKLSWIERKVASTLFAEVPSATVQDAIDNLQRAYDLKPCWKENVLYLAKCKLDAKQTDEAKILIEKGLSLPQLAEDDQIAHKELLQLKSRF